MKEELCGDEGTAKKTRKTKKSKEAAYYADLARQVMNYVRARGNMEKFENGTARKVVRFFQKNNYFSVMLYQDPAAAEGVDSLSVLVADCATDLEAFTSAEDLIRFQFKEGPLMFFSVMVFNDLGEPDGIAEIGEAITLHETECSENIVGFTQQQWHEKTHLQVANGLRLVQIIGNRICVNFEELAVPKRERQKGIAYMQADYHNNLAIVAQRFGLLPES